MAQAFYYEIRYLQGTEKEYMLQRVSKDGSKQPLFCEPDSEEWLALLAHQKSFRFEGQQGGFTARQETRQDKSGRVRGETYWTAYRKVQKHQFKKYLGTNNKLTCINLENTAQNLEETIRQKLGISDNEVIPNFRQSREKRDKETIQHLLTHNKMLVAKNEMLEQIVKERERTIQRRDSLRNQAAIRFDLEVKQQDQIVKQQDQTIKQQDQIIKQQDQIIKHLQAQFEEMEKRQTALEIEKINWVVQSRKQYY